MIATAAAGGGQLLPVLALLAVIVLVGAPCLLAALVWDREPWWRKTPKPERLYRDDKERVKDYQLRQAHPEAFPEGPVPKGAFADGPTKGKESP